MRTCGVPTNADLPTTLLAAGTALSTWFGIALRIAILARKLAKANGRECQMEERRARTHTYQSGTTGCWPSGSGETLQPGFAAHLLGILLCAPKLPWKKIAARIASEHNTNTVMKRWMRRAFMSCLCTQYRVNRQLNTLQSVAFFSSQFVVSKLVLARTVDRVVLQAFRKVAAASTRVRVAWGRSTPFVSQ